ncbi:MAG: type II secretion system protein J [Patescibacteria group bacterium]
MAPRHERGFSLIEIIMALTLTAILVLTMVTISRTMDRSNRGVGERIEAEHSGQATLEYILRDLSTATAFYISQAHANSIGYRTGFPGDYAYWRLFVGADQRLKRQRFPDNTFDPDTIMETLDISDGINDLQLRYFARDASGIEEIIPGETTSRPSMFYMIQITFTVTVGQARVRLGSAVSTLNIRGEGVEEIT